MAFGAGLVAALRAGAGEIVDPRPFAEPAIAGLFARYAHLGKVLPAVGYGAEQLAALAATLERAEADVVVSGTPIDLARVIRIGKPIVRARYEFAEASEPGLGALVDEFVRRARAR
jgi:predicted GTPase